MKRKAYLRLRERYRRRGKEFGYLDESGFEPFVTRRYAYAPKGQRVYGLISGHKRPRTSLLAARIGRTFEAPLLLEGTCNADVFNTWLEDHLCPLWNDIMWSSWIMCRFTKAQKPKSSSTLKEQPCSSCLPILPISTPSKTTSPTSNVPENTTNIKRSMTS